MRRFLLSLFFVAPILLFSLRASAADPDKKPETKQRLAAVVTKLFNGKDLTGWEGDPRLWSVKDGAIVGQTTPENPAKGNTFLIWTNGTVGDFELRCSFKLT